MSDLKKGVRKYLTYVRESGADDLTTLHGSTVTLIQKLLGGGRGFRSFESYNSVCLAMALVTKVDEVSTLLDRLWKELDEAKKEDDKN